MGDGIKPLLHRGTGEAALGAAVLYYGSVSLADLESLLSFGCGEKLTGNASAPQHSHLRIPLLVDFSFPSPRKKG